MSIFIQDLLRDPPPIMICDMGLGSREQSLPVHDTEPLRGVDHKDAETAQPSIKTSVG